MPFTCIDIGGTNTLIGVGNDEFEVVETVESAVFLEDMRRTVQDVLSGTGHCLEEMETVAFAAAGPIDREDGVFYPPNIDQESVALREPFQDLATDIRILNDCNSAVLGEYVYGDEEAEDLVYLTISTGIGAGIMIDGTLVEGTKGNFGEIGHMIINDAGRACGCGGQDHWEAYCSGKNLPYMAEDLFGYQVSDARTLFRAHRAGDEGAQAVVKRMQEFNARGIANLINLFDPELIAIGGGVALNHADIVVDGLEERIQQESVNGIPSIQTCSLREESVIHGLRAVCNEEY